MLANIYLHPLDELMAALGYRMVRYADDFVVLCQSREEADAALAEICRWVEENGLCLHPDKTHVGDCRQPGEGFEFLGYRFEAGRRWVRKKSLTRIQGQHPGEDRPNARGQPRAHRRRAEPDAARGWFGYFKHAFHDDSRRSTGSSDDGCGRSCASRTSGPASAAALLDHIRWPNAFFAEAGLFALHTAWQNARHSR